MKTPRVFLNSNILTASAFSASRLCLRNFILKSPTQLRLIPLLNSFSSMPQFWNRETFPERSFDEQAPIIKEAKIISLSDPNDKNNEALHHGILPDGVRLLAIGGKLEDFDVTKLKKEEPNVIFVSHPFARKPLVELLETFSSSVDWVHTRSAGLDFVTSPALASSSVLVTNAKGQFSSTLAESTLMACSYFAKDLPRLMRQKNNKRWEKYNVEELRGTTLGIIGYGDIGRACAKLAHVYGMRVIALRRNPKQAENDPLCDICYGNDKDSLNKIMSESDYILCSAPLTEETRGYIDAKAFDNAKPNSVFINVGRGPIVDEDALIAALKSKKLKGAALDVFTEEPLPTSSELWELDNVLISPHNMDQTATFMCEATEFFIQENIPRYIRGIELLNPVDKVLGY